MTDDKIIFGPFPTEKIAQPAIDETRERLAKHIAESRDGIVAEGILRITGSDWTLIDLKRVTAMKPINAEATTYFLDDEVFLEMLPPKLTNVLEGDQWSVRIDIDHRYIGKAAR